MKKTIVCFGDSNTHGYNASTGGRFSEEERYPCLLENYLGDAYLVKEEGLSGRTTVFEDPLTEGLCGINSIYSCLYSHEPVDLLVIMLGTNDVKERFSCNALNISKGLERLIRKAQSFSDAFRNNTPTILVIAPPPIDAIYESTLVANEMGRNCVPKTKALAACYKTTSDLTNCHFLDAASIPNMEMNSIDGMHLTKESHHLLAKELATLIPNLIH